MGRDTEAYLRDELRSFATSLERITVEVAKLTMLEGEERVLVTRVLGSLNDVVTRVRSVVGTVEPVLPPEGPKP